MELQLVSYEQAKTLKELGFPDTLAYQVCPYSYFGKDLIDIHNNDISALNPKWREVKDEDICFAPTLELAAKWLREEKKIYIDVTWGNMQGNIIWCASLNNLGKGSSVLGDIKHVDSYEEALSAGIDKAIEMLKGI